MEKYLVTIQVCSRCAKINAGVLDAHAFCNAVQERLQHDRDDFQWSVESTSCMKVCPVDRITLTVVSSRNPNDKRLTVSREANEEAVVKEVFSFFRPKSGPKTESN